MSCAVVYYQTLYEVPWLLRLKKLKNDKKFQKSWKCIFIKKIYDKKVENYSMAKKSSSVTYYQTHKKVFGSLGPEKLEQWRRQKLKNNCKFCQNIAKNRDVKMFKTTLLPL